MAQIFIGEYRAELEHSKESFNSFKNQEQTIFEKPRHLNIPKRSPGILC
jgi:hypothetical protein